MEFEKFRNMKDDAITDEYRIFFKLLNDISDCWIEYLKDYIQYFAGQELPWNDGERAIVSSLALAISRKNNKSILINEKRVSKPNAKLSTASADLWCCMDTYSKEISPFYIEAKYKSKTEVDKFKSNVDVLGNYKKGLIGMSFREFIRAHGHEIENKPIELPDESPYKGNEYIALIIAPLKAITYASEYEEFFSSSNLDLFCGISNKKGEKKEQYGTIAEINLSAKPTVGFVCEDDRGFVAAFMLLGKRTP